MAEIIPFEVFSKKQEEKKGREEMSQEEDVWEPSDERRLLYRLSDDVQDILINRRKEIIAGKQSGQMLIDDEQLAQQKDIVRAWSDDEVVAFLENPKNHEQLKTKLPLSLALFARVLGKL